MNLLYLLSRVFICSIFFIASCGVICGQVSPPSGFSSSSISDQSATLNWAPQPEATAWEVSYRLQQGDTTFRVTSDTHHLVLDNLFYESTYHWTVRAIGNSDTSAFSPIQWFQTLSPTDSGCIPVNGLMLSDISEHNTFLQWDASNADSLFQVLCGFPDDILPVSPITDTVKRRVNIQFPYIQSKKTHQANVLNLCGNGELSLWKSILFSYAGGDPLSLPLTCDFENDSINNLFSFVNGKDNPWVIGSAENKTFEGKHSLYISTDGGQSSTFSAKRATYSYAYLDLTLSEGALSFFLDFKWKCKGSNSQAFFQVYLLSDNNFLNIFSPPSIHDRIGQDFYASGDTNWYHEHIELSNLASGRNRKLVFMWYNADTTANSFTGASIDDLYLSARYCPAPENLSAQNISADQAMIYWQINAPESNFNLQYKTTHDTAWETITHVSSGFTLDSLRDATKHFCRAQTVCAAEESPWSEVITFVTDTLCVSPSNLHATDIRHNQMTINWENNEDAVHWNLYYRADDVDTFQSITSLTPFISLHQLSPSTTYHIFIRSTCFSGSLSYSSDTLTVRSACTPINTYPWSLPSSFINLSPPVCWEKRGDTLISPSFDLSSSQHFSFSLNLRKLTNTQHIQIFTSNNNGENWVLLHSLSLDSISNEFVTFNHFSSMDDSIYRVAFSFENSLTPSFELLTFDVKTICTPPQHLTVQNTDSRAVIHWATLSGETGWKIHYKKASDPTFTTVETSRQPPFTLNGLTPATNYEVKVNTLCDTSTSASSPSTFFRTDETPLPDCAAPRNLECQPYHSDQGISLICTWTPTNGPLNWEIEYKHNLEFTPHRSVVNLNQRFTLRNVELYRTYSFRIRTICADTNSFSDWSETISRKVTPESILHIDPLGESSFRIFPNPTSDAFYIEGDAKEIKAVEIYTISGQKVCSFSRQTNYDVTFLPKGAYFVKIHTDKQVLTQKLIKF